MPDVIETLKESKEWHIVIHLNPGERVRVLPKPLWDTAHDHALWSQPFEDGAASIEQALAAVGIDAASSPFCRPSRHGLVRPIPTGIDLTALAAQVGKLLVLYRMHGNMYHGYTLHRHVAVLPNVGD